MVGSLWRPGLLQRVWQLAVQLYRTVCAGFPSGIVPAKFAYPALQPSLPADRSSRARRAACLGIRRMPQRPGLWVRTTGDGDQRVYRIKDHNGELFATVGCFAPVAVPTARMPGYWDRLE